MLRRYVNRTRCGRPRRTTPPAASSRVRTTRTSMSLPRSTRPTTAAEAAFAGSSIRKCCPTSRGRVPPSGDCRCRRRRWPAYPKWVRWVKYLHRRRPGYRRHWAGSLGTPPGHDHCTNFSNSRRRNSSSSSGNRPSP